MKLRNYIEILGFKGKPKHYKYRLRNYKLNNELDVNIAQWLHPKETLKEFTLQDINIYKKLIKPGDFCIDIGAHTGDTAIPMSIAAGKKGLVLALEPNPYVYHVLEKNSRVNRHLGNIDTIMAAVTPEEGFMEFEYSDSGFCNGGRHEGVGIFKHGHPYKLEVFGVNLAKELKENYSNKLPKLNLIKVDTEGYDLYVVKSISEIIDLYRPQLILEVFKNTSEAYRKELFSFLIERNYEIFFVEGSNICNFHKKLNLSDINIQKHYDIVCIPK